MNPKRTLTAKKPDGTLFTGSYAQWEEITGSTVKQMQGRMYLRTRQIKDKKRPYSMSEVVGSVKLYGGNRCNHKSRAQALIKSDKDLLIEKILFRESEGVKQALSAVGCMA